MRKANVTFFLKYSINENSEWSDGMTTQKTRRSEDVVNGVEQTKRMCNENLRRWNRTPDRKKQWAFLIGFGRCWDPLTRRADEHRGPVIRIVINQKHNQWTRNARTRHWAKLVVKPWPTHECISRGNQQNPCENPNTKCLSFSSSSFVSSQSVRNSIARRCLLPRPQDSANIWLTFSNLPVDLPASLPAILENCRTFHLWICSIHRQHCR